jgi:hypothetical protein
VSIPQWVGVGLAIWLSLALVLALLIGQVVRRRDKQVPRPDEFSANPPRDKAPDRTDGTDEQGR